MGQRYHVLARTALPPTLCFLFFMLQHEPLDNARLIILSGQLNSGNAGTAESDIVALIEQGQHRLLFDFTQLDYISSAGLRVVLVAAKRLKPVSGKLVLYGMQPQVHEVFQISGFLNILDVVETQEEALRRLPQG